MEIYDSLMVSFLRGASLYIGFKIGLWKVTLRNLKELHKNFHFGRIKIWATLTWTSEPLTGNWVLKMRVLWNYYRSPIKVFVESNSGYVTEALTKHSS